VSVLAGSSSSPVFTSEPVTDDIGKEEDIKESLSLSEELAQQFDLSSMGDMLGEEVNEPSPYLLLPLPLDFSQQEEQYEEGIERHPSPPSSPSATNASTTSSPFLSPALSPSSFDGRMSEEEEEEQGFWLQPEREFWLRSRRPKRRYAEEEEEQEFFFSNEVLGPFHVSGEGEEWQTFGISRFPSTSSSLEPLPSDFPCQLLDDYPKEKDQGPILRSMKLRRDSFSSNLDDTGVLF
jgi:hypothetical protein